MDKNSFETTIFKHRAIKIVELQAKLEILDNLNLLKAETDKIKNSILSILPKSFKSLHLFQPDVVYRGRSDISEITNIEQISYNPKI